MESEKFCLRWNDFKSNISEAFRDLREEKDFFDVTLACEDNQVQAHKVILSACSPFFRNILRRNPHQHPLLYLKDVKYKELLSVINFMYLGEVSVAQDELNSFLNIAEDLRVKGLTQGQHQPEQNSKIKMDESRSKKPPDTTLYTRPVKPTKKLPPSQANLPHQTFKKKVEDDDELITAIKSEPRELNLQRAPVRSYQVQEDVRYGQHEEQHELVQDQVYEEEGIEQGTVALDDGYGVDGGYEYQYEDTGYDDSGENIAYSEGQQLHQGKDKIIYLLGFHYFIVLI